MLAQPQWFFKISSIQKKLLEENEKTIWNPSWAKLRMKAWLEGISDWPVSRRRYWGTPLPIWICDKCKHQETIGSMKELDEKANTKTTFYYMRHGESVSNVREVVSSYPTPFVDHVTDKGREQVKKDGMRNGYLMAIAPTSSISILVGTTQAIEPVYKRKWYEENLSGLIPVVVPKLSPETWSYYTPAYDVDQLDIIKAAAVRQKWIDQGQSTNIFMSLDKASGKYMHQIYTLAWQLGLKSTYYLRSQSPEAANDVEDRSMECAGCQ